MLHVGDNIECNKEDASTHNFPQITTSIYGGKNCVRDGFQKYTCTFYK